MPPKNSAPEIDPGATYQVALMKSIKVGRQFVHPGPNVKLRGDILAAQIEADAEAIGAFEPAVVPGE